MLTLHLCLMPRGTRRLTNGSDGKGMNHHFHPNINLLIHGQTTSLADVKKNLMLTKGWKRVKKWMNHFTNIDRKPLTHEEKDTYKK